MKLDSEDKILVFIDWFKPAYKAGGPIQSVANIIKTFSTQNFWICTSNKDFGENEPLSNKQKIKEIISLVNPSIIYFNSLFSKNFTLKPLFLVKSRDDIKLILAPRGMLGTGALNIKPFKKKVFLSISKCYGLFKNITWHVSSNLEKQEVLRTFRNPSKIVIAPNIPNRVTNFIQTVSKTEGEVKLFFISRISKKKNLHFALEILNQNLPGNITLYIYGPIEDEPYWNICLNKIKQLPKNVSVEYSGELLPEEVLPKISKHHFLFFPTMHENYGHVIIESLMAAKPILISNNTPWTDLKRKNVGWDIPLEDANSFTRILKQVIEMKDEDYQRMSKKAYLFAKNVSENEQIIESNRKLFSLP